jgi:hypothetical protein
LKQAAVAVAGYLLDPGCVVGQPEVSGQQALLVTFRVARHPPTSAARLGSFQLSRSLFIEFRGPVQDDRHGRGLALLDVGEDQKSLPVSANVISEEVPTRSWLPESGLE